MAWAIPVWNPFPYCNAAVITQYLGAMNERRAVLGQPEYPAVIAGDDVWPFWRDLHDWVWTNLGSFVRCYDANGNALDIDDLEGSATLPLWDEASFFASMGNANGIPRILRGEAKPAAGQWQNPAAYARFGPMTLFDKAGPWLFWWLKMALDRMTVTRVTPAWVHRCARNLYISDGLTRFATYADAKADAASTFALAALAYPRDPADVAGGVCTILDYGSASNKPSALAFTDYDSVTGYLASSWRRRYYPRITLVNTAKSQIHWFIKPAAPSLTPSAFDGQSDFSAGDEGNFVYMGVSTNDSGTGGSLTFYGDTLLSTVTSAITTFPATAGDPPYLGWELSDSLGVIDWNYGFTYPRG
jgi:hypothetical protein